MLQKPLMMKMLSKYLCKISNSSKISEYFRNALKYFNWGSLNFYLGHLYWLQILKLHNLGTWASVHDIELKHIEPCKPTQNSLIESFNRTFRENILNAYIFKDLNEAREITEKWLYDYNYTRPHSALGWKSPKQYVGVDLLKTPKKSFQQVNTMMMNMND